MLRSVPSIFLGPFSSCCVLLSLVQQLFPPCAGLREIGAPKVMCCGGWEHHGDVHEKYKIIVLMEEAMHLWGQGIYGKSLYLLLNIAVNLKLP